MSPTAGVRRESFWVTTKSPATIVGDIEFVKTFVILKLSVAQLTHSARTRRAKKPVPIRDHVIGVLS
jgi:hypothetical protein